MTHTDKPFIPSPQQSALFAWNTKGTGNAFVQAVAGAGKTTSLIEGTKKIPAKKSKLLVAFNKKIAVELQERIVKHGIQNAEAATFHAIGMRQWGKFIGKKIYVDSSKTWNILKNANDIPEEYHNFVAKLVSLAKQTGIGCKNIGMHLDIFNQGVWQDLVDKHDLGEDLDKDSTVEKGIEHAIVVLGAGNSVKNSIDFDDMIYLPVLHGIEMSVQYDWVMVDEAQDTNPIRRKFASMLVKPKGRMIWVGDKHQAIYGFTGADADAVNQIISEYQCKELPLTVTYRCPKAVVNAAQKYVSHITAHESAPEGIVENMSKNAFDTFKDFIPGNDAILCRKTAPLVSLMYRLIRLGVPAQIEGRGDIGKQILAMLNKWKKVRSLADFLDKLVDWETSQIAKHTDENGKPKKNKEMLIENIKDRAETIRFLCEGCDTMQCVKDKIYKMFTDSENEKNPQKRVVLSTVHKAKGREWPNVYVYGFAEYMPSKMAKQAWQMEQENNLIYVAFTRAQEKLILVG